MKIKIVTKLNLGLVLGLAVIFAVAALGWKMMANYAEDTHVAYDDDLAGAIQLAEAESALWRLRYGMLQVMANDAEQQREILAEEPKWQALIGDRLATYGAPEQHRTPDERRALADLMAEYARYSEARAKFFELWQAGRHAEAVQWQTLTVFPYANAATRAFERQIDLQHRIGKEAQLSSEADVRLARWLYLGMIASLLCVVGAGYWAGSHTLRPLKRLTESAERTLQEALGENLELSASGNEIDMLVESFNLMTTRLVSHAANLEATRQSLALQRNLLEETVETRTAELRNAIEITGRQNREISLRNEMGELLQSCSDVDEAKAVVARFARALFPAAAGTLYLSAGNYAALEQAIFWNRPPDAVFPASFDSDECWGLRRGKPYLAVETEDAMLCPHLPKCCHGASLCVPLAAHGEIFGLLHLGYRDFHLAGLAPNETPEQHLHVELAESTAAQITLALSNLRLHDALRQQSIRDALTGLYNRRFLEDAIPRELARAMRNGQPLAVFMLDVDHFKKFNDQYGHEAGDAVLRALGRAMKDNCRKGDLACRFGGEEFTVILAATDIQQAREWGERLMRKVRAMEVKSGATALPHIAISMGLALYPEHGEDMETLMQAADLALYDAKHAGRDRLMVSGEGAVP